MVLLSHKLQQSLQKERLVDEILVLTTFCLKMMSLILLEARVCSYNEENINMVHTATKVLQERFKIAI